jgi:hypothetical protein
MIDVRGPGRNQDASSSERPLGPNRSLGPDTLAEHPEHQCGQALAVFAETLLAQRPGYR